MTYDDSSAGVVSDLVERARAGDREAFGELVERSWTDLVALARTILAADREAEDVVQEAFIHAWKRLWMLRKSASFGAWIRRIVVRRCLTQVRRRKPTTELGEVAQQAAEPGSGYDVERLLSNLTARQRAAVYLTWIEGCTDSEAASILGIRAATVRVHRHRGMVQLRRMVGGNEG